MEIKAIEFQDMAPNKISVDMSIEEAAVILEIFGRLSPAKVGELFGEQTAARFEALPDIYEELSGMVFNAYWDDGLNDYLAGDG